MQHNLTLVWSDTEMTSHHPPQYLQFEGTFLNWSEQKTILRINWTYTTTTTTIPLTFIIWPAWHTHWWTTSYHISSPVFLFKYCSLPFSTLITPPLYSCTTAQASHIACPSLHHTTQVCTVQKVKVKNSTIMFLFSGVVGHLATMSNLTHIQGGQMRTQWGETDTCTRRG